MPPPQDEGTGLAPAHRVFGPDLTMLDIKWIRDNAEVLKTALRNRGGEGLAVEETVANLFALDDRRRDVIAMTQRGQEERNRLSKEIGQAMAKKDTGLADALKARVAQLKDDMEGAAGAEKAAIEALDKAMAEIPNIPLADTPVGKDEHDNVVARTVGEQPKFPEGFAPKEHFDIGETLGLMDFESATKMSGARFVVLKGALARLERALGQFMLDLHTDHHGYTEIDPPLLVRDEAMFGTAQLPKFRDDQFATSKYMDELDYKNWSQSLSGSRSDSLIKELQSHPEQGLEIVERHYDALERDIKTAWESNQGQQKFWLIPTAEVPLTNLARDSILDEKSLPMRVTALTPCFRAEAGAAGRDTRGMIRQHQFPKVELVSITTPEQSEAEHERMTGCAEDVLKKLGLHYRVMTLCTGDMGFASRKTYDIEVWLPGQNRFREISSCSVCGDFQARRMKARYRGADGKVAGLVHTLNGSGVAVGRALIAVLENYQNEDGSVTIPPVQRPYMGGMERIAAK
jgi:seryl-tRNA synthetase